MCVRACFMLMLVCGGFSDRTNRPHFAVCFNMQNDSKSTDQIEYSSYIGCQLCWLQPIFCTILIAISGILASQSIMSECIICLVCLYMSSLWSGWKNSKLSCCSVPAMLTAALGIEEMRGRRGLENKLLFYQLKTLVKHGKNDAFKVDFPKNIYFRSWIILCVKFTQL